MSKKKTLDPELKNSLKKRKEKFTHAAIAKKVGVSTSAITLYLNGYRRIPKHIENKIKNLTNS
jgi:predicted transcriptional regulator